jgi:hypothetical protein
MSIVPSYLAKVNRAEQHLVDLEAEIARYAARNPYAVADSIEGKNQRKVRRLVLTEDPADTGIAIMAADALYNLRSALDHLMGALVPNKERHSVMFPVFFQGVWEAIEPGENEQRVKERARWASVIKSLPAGAVAFLKELQPPNSTGDDYTFNRLVMLNRLSNRDRHEKLPIIALGLRTVILEWTLPSGVSERGAAAARPNGFFEHHTTLSDVPDDAMDVKVDGSPVIVIRTGQKGGDIEIPSELVQAVNMIRGYIIPQLAPFVRADAA